MDVKTGEMLMSGWTLTGEGCKKGGGIGVVMRNGQKRWCSCCDGAEEAAASKPAAKPAAKKLVVNAQPKAAPTMQNFSAATFSTTTVATTNSTYQVIMSRIEEATQNLSTCDLSNAKQVFHWSETIERLSKAGKAFMEINR